MEPDVTYYEALGVESTASAEEIRRAYRKLVRLLHPDQYQDEVLRRICERQLARLNGIAEILADPEQRREYDLGLEEGGGEAARGRGMRRVGEYLSGVSLAGWVWVAAGVAGVGLMALMFRWNGASGGETQYRAAGHSEEGNAQSVAASAAAPKGEKAADAAARRKAKGTAEGPKEGAQVSRERRMGLSPTEGDEDVAARSRARLRTQPTLNREGEGAASSTVVAGVPAGEPGDTPARVRKPNIPRSQPGVSPDSLTAPAAAGPREGAQVSRERSYFAGHWFFSRDVSRRDATLYPPEMIEVSIREENGVLRGKYRGRYRVTDRPISPDVNFEFTGPVGGGETAELGWSGAEAEGRIRLTGITPVSMEVRWWATRTGALDLASGTAVLIRAEEK